MKMPARLLLLGVMMLSLAGCAGFAQALTQVASEMERQNEQNAGYDDYEHTARNTSAEGIK